MYSLWLMPDEPSKQQLNTLLTTWSESPPNAQFEPHITLLTGIQLNEKQVKQLSKVFAAQVSAFNMNLLRITYLESFYRCLFFRAEDTPLLFYLRQKALVQFEVEAGVEPFVPHLSFLYGNVPRFKQEDFSNGSTDNDGALTLRFDTLQLIKTELSPEFWEVLLTIPLNK
jgi:2'-5' RNA ligase